MVAFDDRWWLLEDAPFAFNGPFIVDLVSRGSVECSDGPVRIINQKVTWDRPGQPVSLSKDAFIGSWSFWHSDGRPTEVRTASFSRRSDVLDMFHQLWATIPNWTKSMNPFAALVETRTPGPELRLGEVWADSVAEQSVDWPELYGLLPIRCYHCRTVLEIPEGPVVGLIAIYQQRNHWLKPSTSPGDSRFELSTRGFEVTTCGNCLHPVGYQDGPKILTKALFRIESGVDEVYS